MLQVFLKALFVNLFDELITQIHRQPLRWRLIVIVGKPSDPTDDPSIGGPADREQVDVGSLMLDRVEAEELSVATDIIFDPLICQRVWRLRTIRCSAFDRQSMWSRTPGAPARRNSRARSRPRT